MFYIGLYRENMIKIFLPQITRTKALIFGMWHHLGDHYQGCLHYVPGAKNGSAPGSHGVI